MSTILLQCFNILPDSHLVRSPFPSLALLTLLAAWLHVKVNSPSSSFTGAPFPASLNWGWQGHHDEQSVTPPTREISTLGKPNLQMNLFESQMRNNASNTFVEQGTRAAAATDEEGRK